jgi:C1A family cysteine protease
MIKQFALAVSFSLFAASAHGQGAILETMADLPGATPPATFRGQLPAQIHLTGTMPPVRGQAESSTCVSWAATYAAASQAARRNGLGSAITFSPAFTYNIVTGDHTCQSGSSASATLNVLKDTGALPIEEFAFDAGFCGRQPTAAEKQRAARYRIKGWHAFDAAEADPVKQQIARGVPVIFGLLIGPALTGLKGDVVLQDNPNGTGGHEMIVVGYDDNRKAFRIQNSWGRKWADGGYGWFSYDFWKRYVKTGFVID